MDIEESRAWCGDQEKPTDFHHSHKNISAELSGPSLVFILISQEKITADLQVEGGHSQHASLCFRTASFGRLDVGLLLRMTGLTEKQSALVNSRPWQLSADLS